MLSPLLWEQGKEIYSHYTYSTLYCRFQTGQLDKKNKGHPDYKVKSEILCLVGDMILYTENPKASKNQTKPKQTKPKQNKTIIAKVSLANLWNTRSIFRH